jgi:hypothetical protein
MSEKENFENTENIEDDGMDNGRMVLCGANSYDRKYYFNKKFDKLPKSIQDDLHIICVLFTEEVGGIFTISFEEDGEICLETRTDESDITYDDVSSGLLIGQIRKNREELFESLKAYYRVLILHEDLDTVLGEED